MVYGCCAVKQQEPVVKTFRPNEVAILTGWRGPVLNQLRFKGALNNYGTLIGGKSWCYSLRDVAALWIASQLHGCRDVFDIRTLFAVAWTNAPKLLDFLRDRPSQRYVAILHDNPRCSGDVGGSSVIELSSLEDLGASNFDVAQIVDLKHLADTMPDDVRGALREE